MLHSVLQACRKYVYTNSTQDDRKDEQVAQMFTALDDLGEVREYLIHLMSSESSIDKDSGGLKNGQNGLLEEIEMFFRTFNSRGS